MITKKAIADRVERLRKRYDLPQFIPANILWYMASYYAVIQIDVGSIDVVNGYGRDIFQKVRILRAEKKEEYEPVFSWTSFDRETLAAAFEERLPDISDKRYYKDWTETRRVLNV